MAALAAVGALSGCGSDATTTAGPPAPLPPAPLPPAPVPGPVPPPFVQPALEQSFAGKLSSTLNVALSDYNVNGEALKLRSYNNQITGPTLRVRPGDKLKVKLINNLAATADQNQMPANENTPHAFNNTNLHTHGLHVSPSGFSDNIFVDIQPGQEWPYEYDIPLDHPPGTFWYHPHKHGSSSMQLFSGMCGALIVQGGLDDVPEIAAARDLVYLIQELNVDGTGQVPNFTGTNFGLAGRRLLVNGEHQPVLKAFSGEVIRLRLINGSVRTNIPFAIDDHSVHVASLDGITVPTLRTGPSVFMAPAGRSDILVRCQGVGLHAIKKLADANNPQVDGEVILGFLEVLPEEVTMDLPTVLPVPPELTDITAGEVTVTRNIKFSIAANGGPPGFSAFTINDKLFSKNDVLDINLNAVEQWNLTNDSNTGHPFHIHVNPFQVISVNGVALNPPEWRDTVLIPKAGNVVIRHRFTAFTGLYVFHCHILPHEDLGMMQIVNVI